MPRPRLTPPHLKIYQAGLAALGGYRGEIDGLWGDLSETAQAHALAALQEKPDTPDTTTDPLQWWSGPAHLANSTGVRHKNPLNIKATIWKGATGTDSRGHAIFTHHTWGIRAAAYQLRTNEQRDRLDTVAKQLAKWAPTTDTIGSIPGAPPNAPADYARFIQKRTGLNPNQKLRLFSGRTGTGKNTIADQATLSQLIAAMAEYEIGAGFRLHPDAIAKGLALL